ncbi:uncharacterized protein LOC135097348 [Scylla paramamosain]|uniref:uncharacterized protein LOC135097348 n=1 Tax=Scylla paramamosain TaxID=85552 RepID=UPI003083577B
MTMLGGPETAPGPFPEDQMLRLDRELDQRMMNLLRPRPKVTGQRSPHNMTHRPTHHHPPKPRPTGHIFGLRNGQIEGMGGGVMGVVGDEGGDGVMGGYERWSEGKIVERGGRGEEERIVVYDKERKTGRREKEEEEAKEYSEDRNKEREENYKENTNRNIEGDKENENQSYERRENERLKEKSEHKEDEEEEEKEEDYAIFDEFLDASTRCRLRQLASKVEALSQALHLAREECQQMASSKRESSRAVQAAERECRAMAKQTQVMKQELARLQKTNADLRLRVKELGQECQALRKEASEARQREACRGAGHTSLQGHLTRARAENLNLKEQLVNSKALHKEEVEELRRKLREGEEKRRDVERDRRELRAVTKKQDKLIEILHQQKSHLAAAKATAGLEQKFLSLIAPLHHP